jgi:hypothetical protein
MFGHESYSRKVVAESLTGEPSGRGVDSLRGNQLHLAMKILLFLAFICVVPVTSQAHPGKTDRYGGHKCLKECEEWNLYYAEYHTHDKNGKPVRVAGRPKKKAVKTPVSQPTPTVAAALPPLPIESPRSAQTVTVYRYVTVASGESRRFNPLLWILLFLLILWLMYRMIRRKS